MSRDTFSHDMAMQLLVEAGSLAIAGAFPIYRSLAPSSNSLAESSANLAFELRSGRRRGGLRSNFALRGVSGTRDKSRRSIALHQ